VGKEWNKKTFKDRDTALEFLKNKKTYYLIGD
jgi:hypothetical protein